MKNYIGQKVIVRSYEAGVYFGTLEEKDGTEVRLSNARNIWKWEGATCLSQAAVEGIASTSKVSVVVPEMIITGVCQIIPCSVKAIENIESIAVWEY